MGLSCLAALVQGSLAPSSAREAAGWRDTNQPDCVVWLVNPFPDEALVWFGSCLDGKAEGPGTLVRTAIDSTGKPATTKVTGTAQAGRVIGPGEIVYERGRHYIGELVDGQAHGHGRLYVSSGLLYDGTWQSGGPTGEGVMMIFDGSRYVGQVQVGLQHGQGSQVYPDGSLYVGAWADGSRHGQGTLSLPDGSYYVGGWLYDRPQGEGTLTIGTEIYAGDWKEGCFNDGQRTARLATTRTSC